MKTMILAAGLGTRLRPLTEEIPKPMVPIVNTPVSEHILKLLASHGFKDILMNIHYYSDTITNYFQTGSKWGLNILYSFEESLLGTAGGVKKARAFFGDETFLVICGDVLTDMDLNELVDFHKRKNSKATIVLTEVENPSKYGIVITDKNDKIVEFQEKPFLDEARSRVANSGIYVLEPEIFDLIPESQFFDFGRHLFPLLAKEGVPFYGFCHDYYWNDVGELDEYRKGNFDALMGKVKVDIPGTLVSKGIWVGKGCIIEEGVTLSPPICIGDNCVIKRNAKLFGPLVIGNETVVGEGAVFYKGIKWNNGYIGRDATILGGIIGASAEIGERAVIKEAVLGDKCVIGGGSVIHPSVKIASHCVIDDYSEIKEE